MSNKANKKRTVQCSSRDRPGTIASLRCLLQITTTMKRSSPAVLACLLLACMLKGLWGCSSSGFGGCECNILGACDIYETKMAIFDKQMSGYAPSGVEQFGLKKTMTKRVDSLSAPNLAYVCEGNTVAILYDCNARIPLYAATMMTGEQLAGKYVRPAKPFQTSGDELLDSQYQQTDVDYSMSTDRNLCYESESGSQYLVDTDWYSAKVGTPPKSQLCVPPYVNTPVHKGHLIAARYGRGDQDKATATFTYTNVVPQFGVFNSCQWSRDEGEAVKWSAKHCLEHDKDARLYIVVGAIPSTFDTLNPRFFGNAGFSDYQGESKLSKTYGGALTGKERYQVNVPRYMWTAVCCTYQFRDENGNLKNGVQSRAFYRENEPGKEPTYKDFVFTDANLPFNHKPVVVFPQNLECKY